MPIFFKELVMQWRKVQRIIRPGGHVVLQMVSPIAEHFLTVKTPGAQTVQLILPFPGHITPVGQGKSQVPVVPGLDQVLGGQNRC